MGKNEHMDYVQKKQAVTLKCTLGEGNLSDSDATDCSDAESNDSLKRAVVSSLISTWPLWYPD